MLVTPAALHQLGHAVDGLLHRECVERQSAEVHSHRAASLVPVEAAAYIALLRRRWAPIVLCLIAGIAGALSIIRGTPQTYRATTQLIINIPAAREVQEALQGFQLSSQLLASYARVATSRSAAAAVVEELDLAQSPGSVQRRLSAEPVPETLLMTISAEARRPEQAAQLADAAAGVFVEMVADLERGKAGAIEPRIIDRAQTPSTPISPRPTRDLAIGAALGLLAGGGLALLLESLDRSVRTPAEAAQLARAPILAMVPKRKDAGDHPVLAPQDAGTPAAEAYRVLRTAVRFVDPDRAVRSLVVTSPSAGDGKTSTAANLAVALAQAGERVVLVDADLRRTKLASHFAVESDPGLTSLLIGEGTLDTTLVEIAGRLSFLPTGPLPPNPSELLGSEAMARLLRELRSRCDVLLLDSPPLLPVTDAQVLSTQVDGVLLVARFGRTQRDLLTQARDRLDVVGARTFGCVLNGVPASADYSDEYSYSAYRAPQAGLRRWTRTGASRGRTPTEAA